MADIQSAVAEIGEENIEDRKTEEEETTRQKI